MNREPMVSVIVPARCGEKTILECISSLLNLDYPPDKLEIILVNDGSPEAAGRVMREYAGKNGIMRYMETPGVGPSRARNLAIQEARGEYVAFTDADCMVEEAWLRELLRGFEGEEVAGVGGAHIPREDAEEFERDVDSFLLMMDFIAEYRKKGEKPRAVSHVASCNSMYLKKVLLEVGGFDENMWPGEDVDLDQRIIRRGYRIRYNPAARVRHQRPKNMKQFFAMMKRYGMCHAYLAGKYGFFRPLQYLPVLEAGLLMAWLLLAAFNAKAALALGGFLLLGGFILCLRGGGYSLRRGARIYKLLLATLLAWNMGYFKQALRGRKPMVA